MFPTRRLQRELPQFGMLQGLAFELTIKLMFTNYMTYYGR